MNNVTNILALLALSSLAVADVTIKAPEEGGTRLQRFANPPASARLLPIRHRTSPDTKQIDNEITNHIEWGYGGYATNVSFNGYVDDPNQWPPFLYRVEQARKTGMTLWLYDECGYPSGTARDLVLKNNPEWEARGMLAAYEDAQPGEEVELKLPPGNLHLILAFPMVNSMIVPEEAVKIPLPRNMETIKWKAPETKGTNWKIVAFSEDYIYESTHAAISLARKEHYINLLMPEPTAKFIQVTHDAYAEKLGDKLKWFTSTFTDEPSLMSVWSRPMPYLVIPWAPELPKHYQDKTKRDLFGDLPALFFQTQDNSNAQKRFDFWSLVGDLVAKNFCGQITDWCTKHGILSGGHLLAEEGIEAHVPYYGDFFKVLRGLSAPSIDCLNSLPPHVPWQTALFASSAAELNGNKYVMCEISSHVQSYRPQGDTRPRYMVSETEVIGSLNRLAWGGVNTFTSYYNISHLPKEQHIRINEQIGRVNTIMAEGHSAADIAVLYPAATLQSTLQPLKHGAGGRQNRQVANAFRAAGSNLFNANRSFIYIDADTLENATIKNDTITYRNLVWNAIVLPAETILPQKAMDNLHQFWQNGGIVVAIGDIPQNSTTQFPSPSIKKLAMEMFGDANPNTTASTNISSKKGLAAFLSLPNAYLLPQILDKTLQPPVADKEGIKNTPLRTAHRRTEDGDVFLIINDNDKAWDGSIVLATNATATIWNPEDGTTALASIQDNAFKLQINPYAAKIITTTEPLNPIRRYPSEIVTLPQVVEIDKKPDSITNSARQNDLESTIEPQADGTVKASATVKTTNVDTFQFVSFNYDESPFKADQQGIFFELSIPDGQPHAPNVFCFVRNKEKTPFLATTQYTFAVPSKKVQVFIPFSQFGAHGHNINKIEAKDITSIQIGWGGYFGVKGQTIDFITSPPKAFK